MKTFLILTILFGNTLTLSYLFKGEYGIVTSQQTEILYKQTVPGRAKLIKCLERCMIFCACSYATYISNECVLYTKNVNRSTSSTLKVYTRNIGRYDPAFYWPIYKSSVKELVAGADLYNPYNAKFAQNRFGESDSAIKLNYGYYFFPGRHYFTGDFTTMVWIKKNSLATYYERIMECGSTGSDTIIMSISDRNGNTHVINTGKAYIIGGIRTEINFWYHITFVLKENIASIYVDGKLDVKGRVDYPLDVNRTLCFLGKSSSTIPYLNADIDDIKIFNRALDENEIKFELFRF
ncbi:unnamed protein product [Brachionus calyciflorus]|uniref:Uncharacterized protein n=1 Tax=Brachionus calyciflorus TaxID=104777 RepID=A0A814IHC8_9BILA|nr:unnamed protein product [Brachionus calyciflorus]